MSAAGCLFFLLAPASADWHRWGRHSCLPMRVSTNAGKLRWSPSPSVLCAPPGGPSRKGCTQSSGYATVSRLAVSVLYGRCCSSVSEAAAPSVSGQISLAHPPPHPYNSLYVRAARGLPMRDRASLIAGLLPLSV